MVFEVSIVESSPLIKLMVSAERRVNSRAVFELYYDYWIEFNLSRDKKKPFARHEGLNYKYN